MLGKQIFSLYAKQDQIFYNKLKRHLSSLVHNKGISILGEHEIAAGMLVHDEILTQIERANIILLLISSDFLASYDSVVIQYTWRRYRDHQVILIPVLIRAAEWKRECFGGLNPLPSNGKPVTLWSNRDAAWEDVVNGLQEISLPIERTPVEATVEGETVVSVCLYNNDACRRWMLNAIATETLRELTGRLRALISSEDWDGNLPKPGVGWRFKYYCNEDTNDVLSADQTVGDLFRRFGENNYLSLNVAWERSFRGAD